MTRMPPRTPTSGSTIRATSPWTPYLMMFVASSETAMAISVARRPAMPISSASSWARLRAISTSPMARTGNLRSSGSSAPRSAKGTTCQPGSEAVTAAAPLGLPRKLLDLLRLAQVELERVAQVAHGADAGEVDADVGQGLGDAGVDAGQDAVGAEQADRLGHLDEVVG